MGHKISKEQIDPSVKDHIMSFVGNKEDLETSNTSDIINAVNSLIVDRVDNAANMNKLASSIGTPVTGSDNIDEVCDKVDGLVSSFKTAAMNNGIAVEAGDKFKQLIEKIALLSNSEDKGIKYANGTFNELSVVSGINSPQTVNVKINLDFIPTYIFVNATYSISNITSSPTITNNIISNLQEQSILLTFSGPTVNYYFKTSINNLSTTGFDITFNPASAGKLYVTLNDWYAIGVGEEDTVLLDSLKSILQDEGVEVTDTDTMVDLIVKVDNEFNNKNNNIQTNRDKLYNLMLDGGFKVTNDMSLDTLLEMIKQSGIGNSDIKYIRFGGICTEATFLGNMFILKENGKLYGCGGNALGQLGLGDTESTKTYLMYITDNVKEVYSGYSHTFILKNDGSLWACGHNNMGQLGLGDTTNRTTFTQVTTNINNDVKEVACGYLCTFIIKNDGSLWACGYNSNGQLGLNDTTDRTTFTQVTTNINNDVKEVACGYNHTFIVKNDGSLWSCGYNNYGQLGLGDSNTYKVFTQVTTNVNNDIKQVECGTYHTFILKNDGSLWSCGYNDNGQLGLGNSNTCRVFTQVTANINNDVKQISSYCCYHAMIIKNDGSLWACGRNSGGQLGLGNNAGASKNIFTQVTTNISNDVKQVECCAQESVILKNDGTVWVCGYSSFIGLGYTSQTAVTTFTKIPEGFTY